MVIFLHCFREKEASKALHEAHSEIYEAHQFGLKLYFQIKYLEYYWPAIVKDCMGYTRRCKSVSFMQI